MMTDKVVPMRGGQREQAPVTEDSLAILLAAEHGSNIRFCPQHGRWYVWDGKLWMPDTIGHVFERARGIGRLFSVSTGKDRWASFSTIKSIDRFARTQPELVAIDAEWNADTFALGTPNGTVDLRTGELRTPERTDMITKTVAVAPEDGKPTLWLRFLHEACAGDGELVAFIQRMCGYALSGDTSEQCLFFFFGPGKNGKSVLINTVSGIMADYAVTAAMDTLNATSEGKHSTDLAMLRGARLVTASETDEGNAWAEGRVKQLTGRDKITARFMRQDNFTYLPEFKLVIIGNHKPVLNTVDDAIRRRFNMLPFIVKPPDPDPLLEDKLHAEWPRILRWMIDGALDWQAEGLRVPARVQDETADYFADQDLMQQWLDDHCTVDTDQYEYGQKLYESYCRFLDHAGERKMGRKTFTQAIRRKGFIGKHHTFPDRRTGRLVLGLYLKGEGPKGTLGASV